MLEFIFSVLLGQSTTAANIRVEIKAILNDESELLRLLKSDPECEWLRAQFPAQFLRNDIDALLMKVTTRVTGRVVFGAVQHGITTDMFWYFARHVCDLDFCMTLLDHGVTLESALGFSKRQNLPCLLHAKEGAGVNTMRNAIPCRHCLQGVADKVNPLTKSKAKAEGIKGPPNHHYHHHH